MKTIKFVLTPLLGLFFVFLTASFTFASSSYLYGEAAAGIDYDYISISYTGSYDLTNTSLLATAGITGQDEIQDSENAELESAAGTYYAWGDADINDDTMDYQDIYTFVQVSGDDVYGYSQASAGYFGTFKALTDGTLKISIDYYLYYNVQAGTAQTVTSTASVIISINGEQSVESLSFTAVDGDSGAWETEWETLSFSYDLTKGQIVDFYIMSLSETTASPVPVPNAALLMGAGLAGLLGIRRATRA